MKTSNNTWKSLERKVAKLLGGHRNPLSGGASRHTRGDVIHPSLYVECKLRQSIAMWSWFKDTAEKAKKEGKIPILVIKEKSKKGELVVLDIKDFVELTGERKMDIEEEEVSIRDYGLRLTNKLIEGRIFISPSLIEIPHHLMEQPKFKDLITKKDTQTYTATYSFIDEVYSSEEQSEVDKELVIEFLKAHLEGYSVSNEKIEKEKQSKNEKCT